jgi:tetratricopeptide (TPR) repeat protein
VNRIFPDSTPSVIGFVLLLFIIGSCPLNAQTQNSLDRAESLWNQGRFAEAHKIYKQFANQNPTSPSAHEGWLKSAIEIRNWQSAEEALNRFVKIEPSSSDPVRLGTRLYFRQEEYDTAMNWAERYRNREPASWRPYHFMAQIQIRRNNYFDAQNMVESARLRTDPNQWISLDDFMIKKQTGQSEVAEAVAEELIPYADHSTVFWYLARSRQARGARGELIDLLNRGGELLPPKTPPLMAPVDPAEYRYWWSRFHYEENNTDTANRVLPLSPSGFRSRWLAARLTSGDENRLDAQGDVLQRWTDRLLAEWQQSVLARQVEQLGEPHRERGANFFFQEYRDNRYLNYSESALSAILRSLELGPLMEDHQFELASYYKSRGWQKKQLVAARRTGAIGYNPPSVVSDYLEGLDVPNVDTGPSPSQPVVGVDVTINSAWEGPLDGGDILERMIRHVFYHQPAFDVRDESVEGSESLSRQVQGGTVDVAVEVTIDDWDDPLSANVEYTLSGGDLFTRNFYGTTEMKEWRLLNSLVKDVKDIWPWEGTIYQVTDNGAWVNLGRIHGLNQGDTLSIETGPSPFDAAPSIAEILESRARLGFPSPYYRTEVERGSVVGKPVGSLD